MEHLNPLHYPPTHATHLNNMKSLLPSLLNPLLISRLHLLQLSTLQIINHAMDPHAPLLHRLLHNAIPPQLTDPILNILLNQQAHPLPLTHTAQLLRQLHPQRPKRQQPRIQHPQTAVPQRSAHTSTARMATKDDLLDLQMADGILDDSLGAEVGRVEDIGDIAVDEDVTGLEAEDGGFRDAGVGAADPEDFGRLALGEFGQQVGFGAVGLFGPVFVGFEAVGEVVWKRRRRREISWVCWGRVEDLGEERGKRTLGGHGGCFSSSRGGAIDSNSSSLEGGVSVQLPCEYPHERQAVTLLYSMKSDNIGAAGKSKHLKLDPLVERVPQRASRWWAM